MADRLPAPELPGWLEEMVPFDRYRLEVAPGLAIHVMDQGVGRPVVLLHGNPTWSFVYRKVAAALRDEPLRLIMPDLIGLGFSDRPDHPGEHTMENHARWIGSLLEALELNDVIAVVQDWGGPIGLLALSRSPVSLSGVVVLNTAITMPKPGFTPTPFHRFFSTRAGGLISRHVGVPQRVLGLVQGDRSSISGRVGKAYSYPLTRRRGNDAVAALVRMTPPDMDHPTVGGLEEVGRFVAGWEGRSAIVWGDMDPVLGRLRRRHERMFPAARVTATSAGHFVQEEVPEAIADAIRHVAG